MVSSIFVAIIAFAARAVVGQDEGQELSIDPGSVDLAERRIWCRAQLNSCPEICGGTANPNTCDAWECVCANGNSPNVSDYTQTVPFFVCEERRAQCIAESGDSLAVQDECESVECGSRNPNSSSDDASDSEEEETETVTEIATETETEIETSTETVVVDEDDEDEDEDEDDEDEDDSAAVNMLRESLPSLSYLILGLIGFGAFGFGI